MCDHLFSRTAATLALLAMAFCLRGQPAFADMILVNGSPEKNSVTVDEPFTLKISANITRNILGFSFDLLFDPALLALSEVRIADPFLPLPSRDGDDLAGLAYPLDVTGLNVELASVKFVPLAPGMAEIIVGTTPDDPTEGFPEYAIGHWSELQTVPAVVTIEPLPDHGGSNGNTPGTPGVLLPEPVSWILTATGFGLVARRQRRPLRATAPR